MAQTLTPRAFVDKWKQVSVKDRSAYQEHFRDLCALVGHPTPTDGDPTGANYMFEAGAAKEGGGNGFADVWKRGFFAFEYKGKDGNLDRAYQQLQLYRESLQNPPLLIVSDLERIVIHSNFTNSLKKTVVLGFNDLLTPAGFDLLHAVFFEPERFRTAETVEQITADAAAKIGAVAERLRESGVDPQRAAHFLIRIVFCLFAEDVGLLPRDLLRQLLENTQRRPKVFHQVLRDLFDKMAHGGMLGRDLIPHFNGGLFDDADAIEIDSECIRLLFDVALQDWSGIEPSIFGTLFERSLNPSKRAQLGAHYTSRADILLIVEPVLMAPLRRRWEGVQAEVEGLLRGASTRRATALRTVRAKIQSVADELAAVRVRDPACGSGNFLYVALRQLLDMEKEVLAFASEKTGDPLAFPRVSPAQLFGIEKDEYAHELAQTTVWIGYIQWLRENGFGYPAEPILRRLDNIRLMDAVLHIDPLTGAASEPAWPSAEVIVGNPPFLGDKKMCAELGDAYVDALRTLYGDRIPGQSDLVCYWFEKARAHIEQKVTQRCGLLSTNSIRNGANRTVLERVCKSGAIFMAWSDRSWVLDGAAVRVSMIGFDDASDRNRILDDTNVESIHADLTSATDVTSASSLLENSDICFLVTTQA